MTDDIIIDGVTMPTPALSGLTIKKEKIWSNNTGRVANGDMVGDLIAIKYTLEITWPMLSRADAAKIDAAISPAFFVWQKNKPPARQVEGVALASSKKPPVII